MAVHVERLDVEILGQQREILAVHARRIAVGVGEMQLGLAHKRSPYDCFGPL
jgi:hypothetical protein